ncbi:hypothetical protein CYMTET_17596, partial [Cymbomonas tetramitiformis]
MRSSLVRSFALVALWSTMQMQMTQVQGSPETAPSLKDRGVEGCSSSSPCSKCSGDCDSDAECAGSLKCFQRDNYTPVPGCSAGGGGDVKWHDYCYDT